MEDVQIQEVRLPHDTYYHGLAVAIVTSFMELGWLVDEIWVDRAYWALEPLGEASTRLGVRLRIGKLEVHTYTPFIDTYRPYNGEEGLILRATAENVVCSVWEEK